jgi:hypothetical protein
MQRIPGYRHPLNYAQVFWGAQFSKEAARLPSDLSSVAEVVVSLPSKWEALGSIPTSKKKAFPQMLKPCTHAVEILPF